VQLVEVPAELLELDVEDFSDATAARSRGDCVATTTWRLADIALSNFATIPIADGCRPSSGSSIKITVGNNSSG
jgi:hypothetical protein